MTTEPADSDEPLRQLRRAAQGDHQALNELLTRYRDRLRRMVQLRMDSRLRGRVDASDVIQDAYIDATRRIGEYVDNPKAPFFLWLRYLVAQKIIDVHRHHFDVQARDVRLEQVKLCHGALPAASSEVLAAQLLGRYTSPTEAGRRAELKLRLQEALNTMDVTDREIIALRHFEHLTNGEAAQELGLAVSTASKRYIRALKKLRQILTSMGEKFAEL